MPSMNQKRNAIAAAYTDMPVGNLGSGAFNFFFNRRHLAKTDDGEELSYIIEYFGLEEIVSTTLQRIGARDGLDMMREVAERLIGHIELEAEIVEEHLSQAHR